jgi:hypothetical protein
MFLTSTVTSKPSDSFIVDYVSEEPYSPSIRCVVPRFVKLQRQGCKFGLVVSKNEYSTRAPFVVIGT